jgi:hypothetical protein
MAPRLKPGVAFWITCDRGFAVGLMTHHMERIGHLIWLAEPFFAEVPTVEDVEVIDSWRWPILFPLGAALHRKIATRIGQVQIPCALRAVPVFRGSNGRGGWNRVTLDVERSASSRTGPTTDRSLPIYSVVNDTLLKEMLVTGWMPTDRW